MPLSDFGFLLLPLLLTVSVTVWTVPYCCSSSLVLGHPSPYKGLPVFPSSFSLSLSLSHVSFFCLTSHLGSQWMPLLCLVWAITVSTFYPPSSLITGPSQVVCNKYKAYY